MQRVNETMLDYAADECARCHKAEGQPLPIAAIASAISIVAGVDLRGMDQRLDLEAEIARLRAFSGEAVEIGDVAAWTVAENYHGYCGNASTLESLDREVATRRRLPNVSASPDTTNRCERFSGSVRPARKASVHWRSRHAAG
jgi:hypothetical protein